MAVEAGRPFSAPGWLLPWWRHAAPRGGRLRLVVVHDETEVIGLAPCFAVRALHGGECWSFLGSDVSPRVEPLALRGRESEVGAAIAAAIASYKPARIAFDSVPADSHWPVLLQQHWPGRRAPAISSRKTDLALTIDVSGHDFDRWFMGKTQHFRKRLRTARKLLNRQEGQIRLSTTETVGADLQSFLRLHAGRWEHLDGQSSITPAVGRMLQDAVRSLPVPERLRVWTIESGGEAIASGIAIVGGTEFDYWSSGFDERHGEVSPARLAMLTMVEDAFASEAQRLDLGAGNLDYKRRFTTDEDRLVWLWLVPPGSRRGLMRLELLAQAGGRSAVARLPLVRQAQIRSLRTSLRRG